MNAKFDYDDVVRVVDGAPASCRPGAKAWVVGVFVQRPAGDYFSRFPEGVVYTIEFEDGEAVEIMEEHLSLEAP